jgi:hypothetical protein
MSNPSQTGTPTPPTSSTRIRRSIDQIIEDDDSLPTPSEVDRPVFQGVADSPEPAEDLTLSDLERLRQENRSLKRLQEAIHFLTGADRLKSLVPEVVGLGISISGLGRGLLALRSERGDRAFKVKVVRGITRDERSTPEVRVLRRILGKTLEQRKPIFLGDARQSEFAAGARDVAYYALGAVCALPLEADGEVVGAIVLDAPQRRQDFSKVEVDLLKSFARHAALALARLSSWTRLARRSERLRNERELLRSTLEETQHELTALRVQSGRLAAQSSRVAAIASGEGGLEIFLARSYPVAKRSFLRHYLKRAIDAADGDLERASRATGLGVAKLVKLLQIFEVKPPRSALERASSSER